MTAGGCNGYSYTMNYAKPEDIQAKKDEQVVENGVTVLVDPKAVFYIAGTVMDYEVRSTSLSGANLPLMCRILTVIQIRSPRS